MVCTWRRSRRISRAICTRSGIGCLRGATFPLRCVRWRYRNRMAAARGCSGCPRSRIAQTVVAGRLQEKVEPIFHPDSYGYRPGRSPLDAVRTCRARCWKYDWVIDLDVQKFFDSVSWDLVVNAVAVHTDLPWVLLYVKRWLAAPI